jgi:hypothetical protein
MTSDNATTRERGLGLAVTSLLLALGSILYPVPGFVELYGVPPGTAGRWMGLTLVLFEAGIGAPLLVIVLALLAFIAGGRISRRVCVVAGLLAFVPLPFYWWLFHWIANTHHLILEP